MIKTMRMLLMALLVGIAVAAVPASAAQAATDVHAGKTFDLRSLPNVSSDHVGGVKAGHPLKDVCVINGWHLVYRQGPTHGQWVTGFAPETHLYGTLTKIACVTKDDKIRTDEDPPTLRNGPYLDAVMHTNGATAKGASIKSFCYLYTTGPWDLVMVPGFGYGIGWVPSGKLERFGTTRAC